MNKLIIGSHVSLSAPDYLLGSVNEALSYGANTFMIYTGPPQNTLRKPTADFKVKQAHDLLKQNNININNVIVHAPYIINLCSAKLDTRELAWSFLAQELIRVGELGFTKLVVHPGSKLDQQLDIALSQVISGINKALLIANNNVMILLETMAGKGSEIGRNIKELKTIIDGIEQTDKIGVCIDTCHLSDSGINLKDFDNYLLEFDKILGLDKIRCAHINDSLNILGSHKDRHANLGYGHIGFDLLLKIVDHPKLQNVPKILETPYVKVGEKAFPPYKIEIEMLKNKKFINWK